MNSQKIDKFFKSKLGNAEIQPGIAANEKFLAKLGGKKTRFAWWRVAASVAILGIAAWVFILQNETPEPIEIATSSETEINSTPPELNQVDVIVNLPQIAEVTPDDKPEIVPLITKLIENEPEVIAPVLVAINEIQITEEIVGENNVTEQNIEENVVIPVFKESQDLTINELLVASVEPVRKKKLPTVRITYISGKRKRQEQPAEFVAKADTTTTKISPFTRIFNSAVSLADGSLIASMRDAKEGFFNRDDD